MLLLQQQMKLFYEAANRYLDGDANVQELNGIVASCAWLASQGDAPWSFRELIAEWGDTVSRRWNEWGMEERPLSEGEFRAWLREQLPFRADSS